MYKFLFVVLLSLSVHAKPVPGDGLISFDNGKIGVNFLGFRAAAGLGGILTGNAADGGLHAEAGTPYGQSAAAGLGGVVSEGRSAGGLYAGATAGGGVSANAGLGGIASKSGSIGKSFADASAGASHTHITKISHTAPVATYRKDVELISETHAQPQTTLVEKTVIPNYVEKTIHVPSYVEKTIRVPTVVEKRIKVPAPPTIIEKTVSAPQPSAGSIKIVAKSNVHGHHVPPPQKYISVHKNIGFGGASSSDASYGGGFGGGFGGASSSDASYGGGFGGGFGGSSSYTVTKTHNPQLFNDIFNIPISTLGAVNNLLNGISGRTSGSLAISKSFGASVN